MRERVATRPRGRTTRRTGASAQHVVCVDLGRERLRFLESECERQGWCEVADILRYLVDARMRAGFHARQRKAVQRVRSLIHRERTRLMTHGQDAGQAVRRALARIKTGNDEVLKWGLRLLRAYETQDRRTIAEMTSWTAPRPPARRRTA